MVWRSLSMKIWEGGEMHALSLCPHHPKQQKIQPLLLWILKFYPDNTRDQFNKSIYALTEGVCCGSSYPGVPTENNSQDGPTKGENRREFALWKGHCIYGRNWYRWFRQIVGKGWEHDERHGEDNRIETSESRLTL